jgi:F-type H+-transporting ATPase subunit epsilon
MAKLFTFEVHTPYRLFFSGPVEALTVFLIDGEIGIYADHSFLTAPVSTGILKIKDPKGQWRHAFTTEGILEVSGHKTVLVVDAAEWPGEIDYERALAAKKSAEEDLANIVFNFEAVNAKSRLKRAETRIKAYGFRAKEPIQPD